MPKLKSEVEEHIIKISELLATMSLKELTKTLVFIVGLRK